MVIIVDFTQARRTTPAWDRDEDSPTWRATAYFEDEIYDLVAIGNPDSTDEPATCEVYIRRGQTRIALHRSDKNNWQAAAKEAEDFLRAYCIPGMAAGDRDE